MAEKDGDFMSNSDVLTNVAFAFAVVIVGVVIVSLILALPLMVLWDALMPDIFGLSVITFWQALGLNLLSGILFKSHAASSKE